jgi:hypothetical protein
LTDTLTEAEALKEGFESLPSEAELDAEIAALRAPLQHRHEQLEALRRDMHERYLAFEEQMKSRTKRLESALKATGWEEKKRKTKKAKGGEPVPSAEAVERLVRWLATQEEPQNYAAMEEALGIANSSANKQTQVARQLDLIRIARMGGRNGKMMFFATFPEAIERLDRGDVQWP